MNSLTQKNIIFHVSHIEIAQKMTEIEKSRKSKMAAAAILNISTIRQFVVKHLVQDEALGPKLHIPGGICHSFQNGC